MKYLKCKQHEFFQFKFSQLLSGLIVWKENFLWLRTPSLALPEAIWSGLLCTAGLTVSTAGGAFAVPSPCCCGLLILYGGRRVRSRWRNGADHGERLRHWGRRSHLCGRGAPLTGLQGPHSSGQVFDHASYAFLHPPSRQTFSGLSSFFLLCHK